MDLHAYSDGIRRILFRASLYNCITQFIKLVLLASLSSHSFLGSDENSGGTKTWVISATAIFDIYVTAFLLRDKITSLEGRSRTYAYALGLALCDLALSHIGRIWQNIFEFELNEQLLWSSFEGTVCLMFRLALTATVWLWARARFSDLPRADQIIVRLFLIFACVQQPVAQ
eukprot:gene4097-6492_t